MPAAGYGFVGPAAPLAFTANNVDIIFDGSIFDSNGQRLYVYRCLWEENSGDAGTQELRFDMSIRGRLLSSWYGRRNLGQRLLQIGIYGVNSEDEAREDIQHRLQSLIIART
jgi:hypothetical protein